MMAATCLLWSRVSRVGEFVETLDGEAHANVKDEVSNDDTIMQKVS